MDKNEKLLKKLDKLLARYGVEDEDVRKGFLDDLSTYKDEAEENTEEETPSTTNEVKTDTKENAEKDNAEKESPETESPETEKTDEVKVEEKAEDKEKAEDTEKTENIENTEKVEETQEEQPKDEVKEDSETQNTETKDAETEKTETQKVVDDFGAKFDEQAKTLEALSSRIASIEEIVAKLGVEQKPVGMEANTQAELQGENDAFDYFTRKRIG